MESLRPSRCVGRLVPDWVLLNISTGAGQPAAAVTIKPGHRTRAAFTLEMEITGP